MNPTSQNSNRNDPKIRYTRKLVHLPEILWEEEIVPILRAADVKVPRHEFNEYRFLNLEMYIANASKSHFVKLLAIALERAGVELGIDKTKNITLTIDSNKFDVAFDIARRMQSFRDSKEQYYKTRPVKMPQNLSGDLIERKGVPIRDVTPFENKEKPRIEDKKIEDTEPRVPSPLNLDEEF